MSDDRLTLADVEAVVAAARLKFARDVDAVLARCETVFAYGSDTPLALMAGGWPAVRQEILEAFDAHLPAFAPADAAQLLQLVREAFDLLNDPESRVDVREWTREARKVL